MGALRLPEHVPPMLARIGTPFASPQHLFEVKWDGVRAMAYLERGAVRVHGRRRRDLARRYPELQALTALPDGTLLDGELVALGADGRPDLGAVVARENGAPERAAAAARERPVHYVVFDLLFIGHADLMPQPLRVRRERLQQLLHATAVPRVLLSEGVVGDGLAMFDAVVARGLEGVVAKDLGAPYQPGERTAAWQKIKPQQSVHCLVLGYEADPHGDVRSLVIATDLAGELRCVGKVGSGLGAADRAALRAWLEAHPAPAPLVPTDLRATWVEPGLYCTVGFLERTAGGNLRAPVFRGLVAGGRA